MSNRTDWPELVEEILKKFDVDEEKLADRLVKELHNAYVAGREHTPSDRDLSYTNLLSTAWCNDRQTIALISLSPDFVRELSEVNGYDPPFYFDQNKDGSTVIKEYDALTQEQSAQLHDDYIGEDVDDTTYHVDSVEDWDFLTGLPEYEKYGETVVVSADGIQIVVGTDTGQYATAFVSMTFLRSCLEKAETKER